MAERAPREVPLVRIFLSSPGDVAEERTLTRQFIDSELPKFPPFREKVKFELIAWDDPAARIPMLATETPQDSVNAARPRPANCDIVIVILWSRMGTPLPDNVRKPTGEPYLSGTEWEYEDAVNSPQELRPEVLVYRRTEEPTVKLGDHEKKEKEEQFERVQAFVTNLRSLKHGINEYETPNEFKTLLAQHLQELIWRRLQPSPRPDSRPHKFTTSNSFEQIRERVQCADSDAFDVFVISAHNLDEIYHVPDLTPDSETDIRPPVYSPGGSGANSAYALAKLGMRVGVAGIIADDPNGNKLKRDLQKVRINLDRMLVIPSDDKNMTGKAFVYFDDRGRRSIFVDQGVNARLRRSMSENSMLNLIKDISRSRILHISSFVSRHERLLCESLVQTMPAESLMTLTPGALYARYGLLVISNLLRRVNLVFLYEKQFARIMEAAGVAPTQELTGRIEAFFRWRADEGHNEPILLSIKHTGTPKSTPPSERYLTLAYGNQHLEMLVFPEVGFVIDESLGATGSGLGAGDALAAGVIYGILQGKNVQDVADLGYLLACFASNRIDARSGLPDRHALIDALEVDSPSQLEHSSEVLDKAKSLFFIYSHKDKTLRDRLETHLNLLQRQGIISTWHDRKILPGTEWNHEIDRRLERARIIVLLISADFIASQYCWEKEVKRALERHEAGEATVIPIILRPCDWHSAPFGKLQGLPTEMKPVALWRNRDAAWGDVAAGIRAIAEKLE